MAKEKEDENEIKLSLTTVIMIFLVFVVVVVLGGMYFCCRCIPRLKEELSVTPESIKDVVKTNINESIEKDIPIQRVIEDNKEAPENISYDELISLLKKMNKLEEFRVTSIKKQNDEYTITANYYVPKVLTEEKFNNLQEQQIIVLDGLEYTYKNDKDNLFLFNEGYGYVVNKDNIKSSDGYSIVKFGEGYAFQKEIGGVSTIVNKIDKKINVKLDKNTIVEESPFNNIEQVHTLADTSWDNDYINNNRITLELNTENNSVYINRDVR